jgi:hypothetical protein
MMLSSLEAANKDVMNKPRISMLRLNGVIRSALSRGLPTWREKLSVGVIVHSNRCHFLPFDSDVAH